MGDNSTLIPNTAWVQREFLQTYPIGICWNYGSSSPTVQLVDELCNPITLTATDLARHSLFAGITRCNITDAGAITARYGNAAFKYDGSNGQVVSWIPGGYYRQYHDAANTRLYRWISGVPRGGFRWFPAFYNGATPVSGFAFGTFPACCYDVSAAAYNLTDAAGVDITATTGDKLASIAGAKPLSGTNNASLTRDAFIQLAQNRGTGWNIVNFDQVSWFQLLRTIRYQTLNSQATFTGVTNITDDGSTNMAVLSGATAGIGPTGSVDLGNTDGQVTINHYQTAQATYPFSCLTVENFPTGNIWEWINKIKAVNNRLWVNDVDTGITLPASNGYGTTPALSALMDYGWLPAAVGGSSSTYFCDYYYQASGDRAALLGGHWNLGAAAGAFDLNLDSAASLVVRNIGARLAFTPQI
jgi:hypothetical protein